MSAARLALVDLVSAERRLSSAIDILSDEQTHPLDAHYVALRQALALLREGAKGYGLELGAAGGLQRAGVDERRELQRRAVAR